MTLSSSLKNCSFREFKKLRRQLQRKRDLKIELCVKLSLLRLFHVGHLVQNRRSALLLAWYEWFSWKAKNERFTAASSRCRQNVKYENFTSLFGRLRQNIAPNIVQHDYFSSFNQSNHWFVALLLTLPSSDLKLPMLCSLLQLLPLVCCVRRHGKLASSFYKCSRYEINIGSKRQKNCFFDLTHSWRVLTLGTKMYREQLLFTSALQYWASKKNWVYLEGCSIVLTDRLSGEK